MGFFDFFRSTKSDDARDASPGKSGWAKKLANYRGHGLDDEEKLRLCSALLEDVGQGFESAKVKPLPDDDEVELRARIDGMAMRVNLEYDVAWVRPELKIENRTGNLTLIRDHEQIAKAKDEGDDWSDGDELRVFVAKGIFVEGDERDINETSATLQALPAAARLALLEGMETLRVDRVYLYDETLKATLPNLPDLEDPVRNITDSVKFLHAFAVALAAGTAGDSASEGAPSAGPAVRLRCTYCSTRFLPGITTNCPNCGAAHAG